MPAALALPLVLHHLRKVRTHQFKVADEVVFFQTDLTGRSIRKAVPIEKLKAKAPGIMH